MTSEGYPSAGDQAVLGKVQFCTLVRCPALVQPPQPVYVGILLIRDPRYTPLPPTYQSLGSFNCFNAEFWSFDPFSSGDEAVFDLVQSNFNFLAANVENLTALGPLDGTLRSLARIAAAYRLDRLTGALKDLEA
jgi:hypothetical protein